MSIRSKIITLTLALITTAGSVSAAPLGSMSQPDQPVAKSMIELVHGCHRNAQDSIDGWHRHVGPYCRPIASGPSERNPYARCRTKCQYVGPIKQCRRVCDY